jgi:cytoskeletal protein RodZ
MSNDLLKKFSKELKETREKKKLSIEQIFTKTRIDKRYLVAIEESNFDIMPNVYIRAFIKEYSKTIGLDPEEVLSKYSKAQQGINVFEIEKNEQNHDLKKQGTNKSHVLDALKVENTHNPVNKNAKSNKTFLPILIAFALLLSIFVIYKTFLTEKNTEIITEKPFDEIVKGQSQIENSDENKDIRNEPLVDSSAPIKKIEQKKNLETNVTNDSDPALTGTKIPLVTLNPNELALTIVGMDKSWIRAVVDDVNNSEFIIDNGATKILTAKSKFYLHIGNSGGVKLLLNNKDIFFSGSPGKVRKINVTKKGIEYLIRTPEINAE